MILTIIIVVSWSILGAFVDAIRFAKGGEDCYEVWHIAKGLSFWVLALYAFFDTGAYQYVWNWTILCVGGFLFNRVYITLRALNVYRLDNRFRIQWLDKILGKDGIV